MRSLGERVRLMDAWHAPDTRNEALKNLIRSKGERAYRYAYGLSGNVDEAKDLVQEALYRVAKAWDASRKGRSMDSFLFRVLHNTFVDGQRQSAQIVSLSDPLNGNDKRLVEDLVQDREDTPLRYVERRE